MATRQGTAHSAANQYIAWYDSQAPIAPMMAPATAEPMAAKRTLRPNRSPSRSWRDSASVRAATAGASTAAAMPCSNCARNTGPGDGVVAISTEATMMASTAAAAAWRLLGDQSTSMPPGTWLAMAATVPALSTKPISVRLQY